MLGRYAGKVKSGGVDPMQLLHVYAVQRLGISVESNRDESIPKELWVDADESFKQFIVREG